MFVCGLEDCCFRPSPGPLQCRNYSARALVFRSRLSESKGQVGLKEREGPAQGILGARGVRDTRARRFLASRLLLLTFVPEPKKRKKKSLQLVGEERRLTGERKPGLPQRVRRWKGSCGAQRGLAEGGKPGPIQMASRKPLEQLVIYA